jgi:hypothetical protein
MSYSIIISIEYKINSENIRLFREMLGASDASFLWGALRQLARITYTSWSHHGAFIQIAEVMLATMVAEIIRLRSDSL